MTSPAGNNGIRAETKATRRSFSLVELLAVVAIMGLMAGAAAVSLRGLRAPALANAANEVASVMKMSRQMAIANGRKVYVVFPIQENPLIRSNFFRAYAILEEVPSGEATKEPDASGSFYTNPLTTPFYVARTDWRTLPEGIIFCNLASSSYSLEAGDVLPPVGQSSTRLVGSGMGRDEWRYFESYTNFDVRSAANPGVSLGTMNNVPFIGFNPTGRALYNGEVYRQGAAIRLTAGIAQGDRVTVTDTNNYYNIETDPNIGRIRLRTRESYPR